MERTRELIVLHGQIAQKSLNASGADINQLKSTLIEVQSSDGTFRTTCSFDTDKEAGTPISGYDVQQAAMKAATGAFIATYQQILNQALDLDEERLAELICKVNL